jgi:hypothetical protein
VPQWRSSVTFYLASVNSPKLFLHRKIESLKSNVELNLREKKYSKKQMKNMEYISKNNETSVQQDPWEGSS